MDPNWADVLTPQTLVLPGPPAGPSKHPLAHLACIEIALVACGSCRFPPLFPQVSHQHVQLSASKIIQIPPPAFASYFFPHVFFPSSNFLSFHLERHQGTIGEELATRRMGVSDGEAVALVVGVRLHLTEATKSAN